MSEDTAGRMERIATYELTDAEREALRMLASTAVWISDEVDEDPEAIARMDRAVALLRDRFGVEHITARDPERSSLEAERDELRATVERYRAALERIYHEDVGPTDGSAQEVLIAVTRIAYRARFQPTEGDDHE